MTAEPTSEKRIKQEGELSHHLCLLNGIVFLNLIEIPPAHTEEESHANIDKIVRRINTQLGVLSYAASTVYRPVLEATCYPVPYLVEGLRDLYVRVELNPEPRRNNLTSDWQEHYFDPANRSQDEDRVHAEMRHCIEEERDYKGQIPPPIMEFYFDVRERITQDPGFRRSIREMYEGMDRNIRMAMIMPDPYTSIAVLAGVRVPKGELPGIIQERISQLEQAAEDN